MQLLARTKKNMCLAKETLYSSFKHLFNNFYSYLPCLAFFFITASFWQLGILSILDKGSSLSDSGLLMGHFMLISGLLVIPLSILSDQFSKRLMVLSGFASISLAGLLRIWSVEWGSDLSFFLLGAGIGCLGAPLKIFTKCLVQKYSKTKVQDSDIYLTIEVCNRLMILVSSFTSWRMLKYDSDLPWLFWSGLSIGISILLLSNSGMNESQKISGKDAEINGGKFISSLFNPQVSILNICTIFLGIEMGIRSVILNPYIKDILNQGDLSSLQLQGVVQASAGFFGTFFFKFLSNRFFNDFQSSQKSKELLYTVFIVVAMLIYAGLNFTTSITHSYSVFLFFSGLAIVSMGWFFPLRDSLMGLYSNKKNETFLLGSMFSVQYISAAITLYFLKLIRIELGEIRIYWKYGSAMLVVASTILICIPLLSASDMFQSKTGSSPSSMG